MLCFYMFLSWKVLSDIGSCGLSNPRGNFFWRITRMYPLKNHRDNLISFVLPHAQKYQQYYPHFCSPQGRGCVSKKYCKKSQKACQPVGRFQGPWGLMVLSGKESLQLGSGVRSAQTLRVQTTSFLVTFSTTPLTQIPLFLGSSVL